MPGALALVTALIRLLRSSKARRCVTDTTAAAPYVLFGKVRFLKFCVAVISCGNGELGDGLEALATNWRASTLLPQVTWSGPVITPEESRSQPEVGELGLLTLTVMGPNEPLMTSVVPLAPANCSFTWDRSSAVCPPPGEVNVCT